MERRWSATYFTRGLEALSNHVINKPMFVPNISGFKVFFVLFFVNVLENILEASVVPKKRSAKIRLEHHFPLTGTVIIIYILKCKLKTEFNLEREK